MKLRISFATLVVMSASLPEAFNLYANAQSTYPCPPAGSTAPLPITGPTTVRLPKISASDGLCLLTRQDATTKRQRAVVSRSYAGHDWERSAGVFAKTGSGVVVDCDAPGSSAHECDVTLPALEDGMEYVLESYEYGISGEAEAARFLEQATFGATRESIDSLLATSNDYASWIEAQLALPASSHSAFLRSHTNPKYEFPYVVGATGPRPCELYSRWRTYAITSRDQLRSRKTGWYKHLTIEVVNEKYVWKVDGYFRTVTDSNPGLDLGARYRIMHQNGNAWKTDCVGCNVIVKSPSGQQQTISNPQVSILGIENDPSILPYNVVSLPDFKSNDLPTIENSDEYPLFSPWIKPFEHALLNTTSLEGGMECDGFPTFRQPFALNEANSAPGTFPAVFGKSTDMNTGEEVVFVYDPHLAMYENTVENPLPDGGGQLVMDTQEIVAGAQVECQNVPRSFLNEDGCKLSYLPNTCSPGKKPTKVIVLDEANLVGINADKGTKLYALTALPITADVDAAGDPYLKSPCASSTSRWVRNPLDEVCANTANLGETTIKTFSDLISGRGMRDDIYYNPNVVDVRRSVRDCDASDDAKLDLGNVRAGDGTCWKHSHPSELSILDFTNADASKYNLVGDSPTVTISDMNWFYNNVKSDGSPYTVIGKLDDHVDLEDGTPPAPLNDAAVQATYQTLDYNPALGPVLICGSPNEVASDPFLGDRGFDVVTPEGTGFRSFSIWEYSAQRHTTWMHLALHAADELRQKMAWSFSQIISVGLPGSGMVFNEETEHWTALYDMFVNHSFGNYLDLMKEFSYNAIMGSWLSFKGNKSLQYSIEEGKTSYPDENFAREIMQLFSIGLYQLHKDGTYILNDNGMPKETYTIEDIMSYARAWTGLDQPRKRGGVSVAERQPTDKVIDPMVITASYRDKMPKNDLIGGYIGDRVQLCEDLPSKHFLRKGATYHALGSKPKPEMQKDRDNWADSPDFMRLRVVLDENLVYDAAAMAGDEYAVDTIRTVELSVGLSNAIYFEYVRQPCVELSFFNNAKKLTKGQIWGDYIIEPGLCGNPKLAIATPMCVDSGWETTSRSGKIYCHYQGERVTYAGAETICAANGREQGHPWGLKEPRGGPCADGCRDGNFRSWSAVGCDVQVKVEFSSGYIAIVNEVEPDNSGLAQVEEIVSPGTINFFKAYWENDSYPASLNDCLSLIAEGAACAVHNNEYCICNTEVAESTIFSSADASLSIDQLMSALVVGAVDPAMSDAGTYNVLGTCGIQGGVTVYSKMGDCSGLSSDAIFAFEWKSKQYFLKNVKATVHISGSNAYSFRNPVQFINLADPEVRDMYHETTGVLESLFYYPSHPPFLASRLIQRFGISNPSPSFIERVALAYETGSYDNGRFGTGKYGDLSALIAAILLDNETREVVLDADPAHGHIREPLVKVLSFFRSMGVRFASPLHIPTLLSIESKIGQGSFEVPSVFSFFLPEYTPNVGSVQSAGLVVPESMVLSGDNVLDLLETMFGIVKFGITQCYKPSLEGWRVGQPFSCASEEASVDDILDELDILLTSGRLTDKNRALIKSIIEPEYNTGNVAKAIRMAQQLVFATPELHSTGVTRNLNDIREISGYTEPPSAPYRAVVVFMMQGGADSFNLLVPTGGCATNDQYQEYVEARGLAHALPLSNLTTFSAASSDQDCDTFGVNHEFDLLAQLYNDGDVLFLANTGLLSKPLTKYDDWSGDTTIELFAHNTMVHEFYRNDAYEKNANTGVFGRILDKLKLKGYQTSANSVGAGSIMLTGDQQYNNPVTGVSSKAPAELNKNPTVANLYEIVKQLNGVGEPNGNVMSETWSSRVAAALFEEEQKAEYANMPEFDIENYGGGDGGLGGRFKSVLEYMKSRSYRHVNREVYVVKQDGYDNHGENKVSDLFKEANNALEHFVTELKNLGLWEQTVIIMGSDFGRSIGTNSNGGTDHAWGGNYFMAGGSVDGGKIMGRYPQPLSPLSDYWIRGGRLIPSTSWDAVWNGVAQWLGLQEDSDLNWAIPNRASFDECTELFSDKDLFTNGACTCSECVPVTYSPTTSPVSSPTMAPHTIYEGEDASFDSSSKASSGEAGFFGNGYANMGGSGSWVEFGNVDGGSGGVCTLSFRYAVGSSNDRQCSVSINGSIVGTLSFPSTGSWTSWQYDTIETACSPGNNVIRVTATSSEGGPNLDNMKLSTPANISPPPTNSPVQNTPEPTSSPSKLPTSQPTGKPTDPPSPQPTADPTLKPTMQSTEKPTQVPTKKPTGYPTKEPTNSPSTGPSVKPTTSPTKKPTDSPTKIPTTAAPTTSPSTKPTNSPSKVPTTSPTKQPTNDPTKQPTNQPTSQPTEAPAPVVGDPVESILDKVSAVTASGCDALDYRVPPRAFDRTTEKFHCTRSGPVDFVFTPSHGKVSIVESLRLFTHNNCPNCDPVDYRLEGRTDSLSPWVLVGEGDLPWKDAALGRNARGNPVESTYESGDPNLVYTEVLFPSNAMAFLDYRVTFTTTRDPNTSYLQFAELELPGLLFEEEPVFVSSSPTLSPTRKPTLNPTTEPTGLPTTEPTTPNPTSTPTKQPSLTPTPKPTHLPTDNPTPEPTKIPTNPPTSQPTEAPAPVVGDPVESILDKESAVTASGCDALDYRVPPRAFDRTTAKFHCTRSGSVDFVFTPSHGQVSIVESLRLYSHNNCPNCDPVDYRLEGRTDSLSPWVLVGQGDLPWKEAKLGRNARGNPVVSTYESGDPNLLYTEVPFPSNTNAFLEYRVTFTTTRDPNTSYLQFAELELPGLLM